MPNTIGEAQRNFVDSGDFGGENKDLFIETTGLLEEYGGKFLKNLERIANAKGVVASGELLKNSTFRMTEDGTTLQIIMPDYYDYPNEGVKGVKSSSNAPNSPYQYKTFGMSAEGRASIKKYIQDGRAKIETVVRTKDKALGIGREKKQLSLLDAQTNTLVYMIKRQGIKATHYFTEALNETFEDFELKLTEAFGKDLIFTLEKLNR